MRRWPIAMIRYLTNEYISNLGMAFIGLLLVMTIGNVFDELNRVIRYNPPTWATAAYFACKIPYHAALSAPLAVLLGTLVTIARLLKSHELVAMRAGGMSQYAIAAPILVISFLLSIVTIAFAETIVPWSYSLRDEIKRIHIRRLPPQEWKTIKRAAVWTPSGKLIYAGEANGRAGLLTDVTIVEFAGMKPISRIDAKYAKPVKGAWEMTLAQHYRWSEQGVRIWHRTLETRAIDVGTEDIFHDKPSLESLSLSELKKRIDRLARAGSDYGEELVFYYSKWAFPFASFIVALLALGISFTFQRNPREGVAKAFGTAFVAAFAYIGLFKFGEALGVGGIMPAWAAVWLPNLVFFFAGIFLLWRAWKW